LCEFHEKLGDVQGFPIALSVIAEFNSLQGHIKSFSLFEAACGAFSL
jgi:hypothetical protein